MPHSQAIDAYDALPIGVAVLDGSLKVQCWNATLAKWSGVSRHQAMNRKVPELFSQFMVDRFALRLESVFKQGQSIILSATMHQQFLPLRGADGQPART